MHHRHALRDPERHIEVVLDDDVADVRRQRREDIDEVAPFVRRQAGGRLVEQDEARRAGEGERDLELALLAVAEFGDEGLGFVVELDGVHDARRLLERRVVDARPEKREAPPRNAAAGEEDRIDDAQAAEEQRDLVGAAQAPADPLVGGKSRYVLAEEADRPARQREVAGDGVEERGLAGSVRAEHGAALARPHGHGNVRESGERAEAAADAGQFEGVGPRVAERAPDWFGHRFRPFSSYGQLGLSRPTTPSLRNSSSDWPRVWLTPSFTSTTLL